MNLSDDLKHRIFNEVEIGFTGDVKSRKFDVVITKDGKIQIDPTVKLVIRGLTADNKLYEDSTAPNEEGHYIIVLGGEYFQTAGVLRLELALKRDEELRVLDSKDYTLRKTTYNMVINDKNTIYTIEEFQKALQELKSLMVGGSITVDYNTMRNKPEFFPTNWENVSDKPLKYADSELLDGKDSLYYLDYNNLTNKPSEQDLSMYAKLTDLLNYIKKTDTINANTLEGKTSSEFALKSDLPTGYALKSDIPSLADYLKRSELEPYALKLDIPSLVGYAKTADLTPYALKTEIPSLEPYALKSYVDGKVLGINFTPYLKKSELLAELLGVDGEGSLIDADKLDGKESGDFALKTDLVNYAQKGEIPNLDTYALKSELPNLTNYALKTDLTNLATKDLIPSLEGYAKSVDLLDYVKSTTLEEYIKRTELANYSTTLQNDEKYALKSEIPSLLDYAKKSEIPTDYIKTSELVNLATKQELTEYAKKTDLPTAPKLEGYLQTSNLLAEIQKIDGTGSLIDSDTLDGQDGSYYLDYTNATNKPDLSIYAKSSELGTYAQKTDLEPLALKTEIPKLDGYALKTDIPTDYVKTVQLADYSTTLQADNKYALKNAIPTDYVKKSDLTSYSTTLEADDKYALKGDIPVLTDYAKKTDIPSLDPYALKAQLTEYALKSELPNLVPYLQIANLKAELLKIDGTGSTLDADLLDGQEGSYYLNYKNLTNKPTIPVVPSLTPYLLISSLKTELLKIDGVGSGLDADLLAGQGASYYLNYNNLTNKPSIPTLPDMSQYATKSDLQAITPVKTWSGTQSSYDSISVKDSNTLYIITG